MKLDEYGITCIICIRTLDGIIEHGPYEKVSDIPQEYYPHFVWISIRDHNAKEIVYIRSPNSDGVIKVQLISDSNVIDYQFSASKVISFKTINHVLMEAISEYKSTSLDFIERLQIIQRNLI